MLKIAYHPIYKHPLPEGHRFPMAKYELLPEQLLHEGTCTEAHFFEPEIPNDKFILAVHDPEYYYDLVNITLDQRAARKIGFPLSETLVEREIIIADGSMKASVFALKQAIAARYLQDKHGVNKVLIVDLDVHQGNGTAEIFRNDPSVFTFSMHGKTNYPFKKEISDLDIALDDQTNDETYLHILKEELPKIIASQQPDFIFYLCGVDVIASDKLGKLGLSISGCKERDRFVLQTAKTHQIPIMCSMGGGYSPELKTIIEAHANTFRLAQDIFF